MNRLYINYIFRSKQSFTPKNTTPNSNTSVFLEDPICSDDNIRKSFEFSDKEYDSVNNNLLTIENEIIEKPVLSTVGIPEYSCFKIDDNDSDKSSCKNNSTDIKANKINCSFVYSPSEASEDQLALNLEQIKSIEKAYEETSSFIDDDSSHTSNQNVKFKKVSLKVVGQEGRKRKFRVYEKQKMKKLV